VLQLMLENALLSRARPRTVPTRFGTRRIKRSLSKSIRGRRRAHYSEKRLRRDASVAQSASACWL